MPAIVSQVAAIGPGVLAQRYMSVSGACILFWDWCLTFDRERTIIWKKGVWSLTKFSYIFIRYTAIICHFFILYVTAGFAPNISATLCKAWFISLLTMGAILLSLANWGLIVWQYSLWDHRRWVLRALMCAFTVSYLSLLVCLAYGIYQLFDTISFDQEIFHTCMVHNKTAAFTGAWGAQVAFDVAVGAMTFWNAADRPRRAEIKLVSDMLRDGFLWYCVVFAVRLANLILCFFHNASFGLMGFFFHWAIVSAVVPRMLLRLEDITAPFRMSRV